MMFSKVKKTKESLNYVLGVYAHCFCFHYNIVARLL